jgi:dipeptidase E
MQLILSGGGNARQTKKLDRFFVSIIPKSRRMLYIPIAMSEKSHTFGSCFDWIRKAFNVLKFKKIDMWTDLANRDYKYLKKYGAVYIGGGNTFSLLHDLSKSGFYKTLKKYIKKGGIVYGGSAGAIILGKDIRTAYFGNCSDKNLVNLKNFKGLNLVRGYSIQCHYTFKDDKKMFRYVKKYRINLIGLPENTGLYVKNKKIKVIGSGNAYIFSEKDKTKKNLNTAF